MSYHILSFDPGLSFSGWAYSKVDDKNSTFTVENFGMITPNKTVDHKSHRDDVSVYGKRIITLSLLRDMMRELLNQYNPDIVASEDAFFNPRRPGAYEALIHWILTVSLLLRDEYQKPLYKIPPKLVKKFISGIGTSNKEGVQEAIFKHKDILFSSELKDITLTEHEGDAIAIGYTQWRLFQEVSTK